MPIADDATLADLALDGSAPPPIAAFAFTEAPVTTLGSLSKLVWPGLRVGWVRAPEPIIARLAHLKSASDLGSALATQAVVVRLVRAIRLARDLRRDQLKPRRDGLAALLRECLPNWTFRLPSGGPFLWVKIPGGDARELAHVALRHGVVVLPGSLLSSGEHHADCMRIPFVAEPDTLRLGVERLAAAWRECGSGSAPSLLQRERHRRFV